MKNLNKGIKPALKRTARGFTIIEVMIVLAIAGLIMVVVFLAVPALERSQRDNARQSIADRVKAEMETYAGNNQGQYPFHPGGQVGQTGYFGDFAARYLGNNGKAPGQNDCNPPVDKVNTCDPSLGVPVVTGGSDNRGDPIPMGATATNDISNIKHGDFYIVYGAKCSGENLTASPAGSTPNYAVRTYAIVIGLDRDGTDYCVDNG